jgi:hypothetical protein
MEEQLITFDTAKLAKGKGFNIPVRYGVYGPKMKLTESHGWENEKNLELINWNSILKQNNSQATSIPTHSLLQTWLRKAHKIDIFITEGFHIISKYKVYTKPSWGYFEEFDSYEEALEKGLQEALKLIKI